MKKKPDWTLCFKGADDKWHKVGAAWNTEKGNISIRLDERVEPGTVMAFPYRERWGSQEQGGYPKGHPGNVRPGESMEQYFRRRRATVNSWPTAEEYLAQQKGLNQTPSTDYMDRKRQERAAPPSPPLAPTDDSCPDPEAPEWL